MSASQVLNASTYYTTLAPNDALPDPSFCNQCKPWKLITSNLLSINFHITRGCQKKPFCPNTPVLLCAKDTGHIISFVQNGSIYSECNHSLYELAFQNSWLSRCMCLLVKIGLLSRQGNSRVRTRLLADLISKNRALWRRRRVYTTFRESSSVVLKLGSTDPFQGFDECHVISVTHFYFLLYWAKMELDKS